LASYGSDQDWTDEAEAEQAAVTPRAGAASLGVPIVTAVLGALVGVLGTSLWWTWARPPQATVAPAVAASAAAPAPRAAAVVVTPAASPVTVVPPTPVLAAQTRESDDAASPPAPPSAAASVTALSAEEVARRRERAWARFYKRPSTCEGNPTGDQLVECGNHYIRMRREFDERWRTGTL
jgi:hypothetical protein